MELFNKSGVLVASVLVLVGTTIAWQAQESAVPAATEIEAMATQISARSHAAAAERRLQEWAELGSPVAQRELALRYLSQPDKRQEAIALFERAASAGDAQAAHGLVGMVRDSDASHGAAAAARTAGRVLRDAAGASYSPAYGPGYSPGYAPR